MKPGKTNLMNQIQMLQCRVNNLSTKKRKTSFARFKVKQRNIYGLALEDTGNLVHSAIVALDFWESIEGKINILMDHQVGTADEQREALQFVRIGVPWPVYLEGMEESYVLEPLVIRGLSHSVNLVMLFLKEFNLKMIFTEEEVTLMPVKDGSTLEVRLVDGRCHSFLSK